MRYFLLILLAAVFAWINVSCSSAPIKPEADNVKVKREAPNLENCKEIGMVQGTVKTKSGTFEQALEDMKLDAARKGANYIHMEQTSAYGTSTRGTAYFCD
jgi:hypothetical protein